VGGALGGAVGGWVVGRLGGWLLGQRCSRLSVTVLRARSKCEKVANIYIDKQSKNKHQRFQRHWAK